MNTVLVVDDDESFLLNLIEGFKSYQDQFSVMTASNGEEAVAILEQHEIHLVLTDLKMPKMDGFALVAYLSASHAATPVIVMTAFGTPEMEDSLREIGAFQYIEKPIDFNVLVSKILKGLDSRSKGLISGVSLSSFVQLLELDKKTCTITAHAGKKKGQLYFKNGNIMDAKVGKLTGIDAAFEIFSWENVEILLTNSCSIKEQKIQESLGFILLEGSRRQDEQGEQESPASAPATMADAGAPLDSMDLAGLDLGLDDFLAEEAPPLKEKPPTPSPHGPSATSPTPASPSPAPHASNPILTQFISMLKAMPEISNYILVSKEGNILHSTKTGNEQVINFITYLSVVSPQLQTAMGTGDSQYTLLSLENGQKVLVICGKEVVVALEIGSSVIPGPIATGLRPVLSRISLQ